MRYLGSKIKLLENIKEFIEENVTEENENFCDLFAGTGAVGTYFNSLYRVTSNDYMHYSYVLNRGKLGYNGSYSFNGLRENLGIDNIFDYFTNLKFDLTQIKEEDNNFIYNNFTEGFSSRKYLSKENGIKVDYIRKVLDEWLEKSYIDDSEYYYLLMCLVESVSKVSNTTGVYGAYLKTYDSRAIKNMEFLKIEVKDYNNDKNVVCNEDVLDFIKSNTGDIVYIDPPYTNQQYCDQYHLLETLTKYDSPVLKGITGKRESKKSNFSYKNKAEKEIEVLIEGLNFKHVIFSYSDQSIVSIERLTEILGKYSIDGEVKSKKISYNKYKNERTNNSKENESKLHEYLFYIRKG
jgi:adenine-specific DNA-methyltransferase